MAWLKLAKMAGEAVAALGAAVAALGAAAAAAGSALGIGMSVQVRLMQMIF